MASRAAQCAAASGHGAGPAARRAAGRRRGDRDGVLLARPRQAHDRVDTAARLPGRAGLRALDQRLLRAREHADRARVRLARSACEIGDGYLMRVWLPAGILLAWAFSALLGPWLAADPNHIELPRILEGPGAAAWLGYDDLGRPVWERLVVGAQTSFVIAFAVVSLTAIMGALIGTVSGYLGGWVDHVVVRIIDIFMAFPGILLAIALAGVLGPGVNNVVIALTVVSWVGFARLARAQVLSLKHREHIQAAVALGVRRPRIVLRHLMPLMWAPLIVEGTFAVAGAVIAEAGLSFLGLGVQPPTASWGSMIRDRTRDIASPVDRRRDPVHAQLCRRRAIAGADGRDPRIARAGAADRGRSRRRARAAFSSGSYRAAAGAGTRTLL